jgi:hypothetical protein
MRTLFATIVLAAWAGLAHAAAPRLLASDIVGCVPVSAGRQALAYDSALQFSLIDLATGRQQPWQPDWDLKQGGFTLAGEGSAYPNLAASADGSQVALAWYVQFAPVDPEQDYPNTAYLLLLCRADGSGAHAAALVEPTDGGPRLDFTADGRYIIGPWYYDCPPTPAGYAQWYANLSLTNEITDEYVPTNALDTQTGQLVHLAGLADPEWGVDKSPYSDWYAYEDMDTPAWHFGCLSGPAAGLSASWTPQHEAEYVQNSYWLGPQELLLWTAGGQLVADMQGRAAPAPAGTWVSFCRLPDGRSFFSRDGGASIELGRVDWRSGQVTGGRACPELAHFAVPYDPETGWPQGRRDTWWPLPGGALVNTPGEDGGGLYLVDSAG